MLGSWPEAVLSCLNIINIMHVQKRDTAKSNQGAGLCEHSTELLKILTWRVSHMIQARLPRTSLETLCRLHWAEEILAPGDAEQEAQDGQEREGMA